MPLQFHLVVRYNSMSIKVFSFPLFSVLCFATYNNNNMSQEVYTLNYFFSSSIYIAY
jgi:hypothetical protein